MDTVQHRLTDTGTHRLYTLHRLGRSALAMWFVHGTGGWSATWSGAFSQPGTSQWDIYVPDLPGCGRSTPSASPGLEDAAIALRDAISLSTRDRRNVIVGHSSGGAVATLVARTAPAWLAAVVNVEGNLGTATSTIARAVKEAEDFDAWFDRFTDEIYRHGISGYLPLRQAHAGFLMADRRTFREMALDAVRLAQDDAIGREYAALQVPRVYFRGTDFPDDAVAFLDAHRLEVEVFEGSGSFPDARCDR